MLFDDKLNELYSIHKQSNGGNPEDEISQLSDDDIIEVILTVRAKIYYNGKKNVVSVTVA